MKSYLQKIINGEHFTFEQSYRLWMDLQQAPLIQQIAVLVLLQTRHETKDELLGASKFMLEHALPMSCPFEVVDMVGTGGDGLKTFNITTAASLLVASCGVYVAKHGGRKVTSEAGSVDVLTCLKIKLLNTAFAINESLKRHRYAFITGSLFNKALNDFAPLRKLIHFPTSFNSLAPLLNPLRPKRQVIGVYRKNLMQPMADALQSMGSEHALVVHSAEGLDEISISTVTYVIEIKGGVQRSYHIHPKDFDIAEASLQKVLGGDAVENARLITDILTGRIQGPKKDIVLLNSAAGLLVSGKVANLGEGVMLAREAVESGRTAHFLTQLIEEKAS